MLDNHSRHQLCFILQQQGQGVIHDPQHCKRVLADLAPQQRLENNLLIAALTEDIAQDLINSSDSMPLARRFEQLAQRLQDNHGTREDFAYWAVESWALALNVIQQPLAKPAARTPYEPEMVFITGGSCLIHSPEQYEIHVTDFEISKYLVTQKQWLAVMGSNPAHFKGDKLPVENISLLDVEDFIDQLNTKTQQRYRLPSEAEWEYACRARTTTAFYTGDTVSNAQANYEGDSKEQTTAVGSYPPNPWGLYDMMGNVWEWTASNDFNDTATQTRRIIRGGSWFDSAEKLQSTTRFAIKPDSRNFDLGFRLSRDIHL